MAAVLGENGLAGSAELLTAAQMAEADAWAMECAGMSGAQLMRHAGEAVSLCIRRRWQPCKVLVVCGPGNNGGDGWVVASSLLRRGWQVDVALLGAEDGLRGDASWARTLWEGKVIAAHAIDVARYALVVDALFGAGLTRALDGEALSLVNAINSSGAAVCAIDVPSGVDASTGAVLGEAVKADMTVSFFRKKPGHLLYPGRQLCGEVFLMDIGIPAQALSGLAVRAWENQPSAWQSRLPAADPQGHKYDKGFVAVMGGEQLLGASMLCAQAAQKLGAGLVAIAAAGMAHACYAQTLGSVMVHKLQSPGASWADFLADPRRNVCVIGPGAGVHGGTADAVLQALRTHKSLVVDADALTVFQSDPQVLFDAVRLASSDGRGGKMPCKVVLTPHEGEFSRLFSIQGDKLARAREAARLSGAVVVLKGADTVVAAPDGRAFVNASAPASLATGGTGDVLAGAVAGLLAQGMPALEAAAAAVWLHSQAARLAGAGLTPEELLAQLPQALALLHW